MSYNTKIPYVLPSIKRDSSRFKNIQKKAWDVTESYFEKRAISSKRTPSGSQRNEEPLEGLGYFTISFVVTTLINFQIISEMYPGFGEKRISKALETSIVNTFIMQIISVFPLIIGSTGITCQRPKLYEYKRSFTDIGQRKTMCCYVCAATIVLCLIVGIYNQLIIPTVVAITGNLIPLTIIIFRAFTDCQQCKKLRIQPTLNNRFFKQTNLLNKDKGLVRIMESSVFKITLKNIGTEPWISENCHITRNAREKISFVLPLFTLQPQEQIHLIPETHEHDGECIRIPNFHCFGIYDRYLTVETSVVDENQIVAEEWDIHKILSDEKKIAEHIVEYEKNEWINVARNSGE